MLVNILFQWTWLLEILKTVYCKYYRSGIQTDKNVLQSKLNGQAYETFCINVYVLEYKVQKVPAECKTSYICRKAKLIERK